MPTNLSYSQPLLSSKFDLNLYVPYFDNNSIINCNESVEYNLINNYVAIKFVSFKQGDFEKFINDIKKENIEFLGIYPINKLSNETYYISCIFGNLIQHFSNFDLSEDDVLRGKIELKFYDIKIIQYNEKFDNNRYLDQVHRLIYEKNMFKKL